MMRRASTRWPARAGLFALSVTAPVIAQDKKQEKEK
jgi:hypothetical protein